MSLAENPNSVMFVPPTLRAARRLVYEAASSHIPLSKIAQLEMGQSPEGTTCSDHPQGMPLLNGPTEFGETSPTPVQWTTSPMRIARPQDLLFCVRGATAGRTNWANMEYAIGRGLAAIRGIPGYGDTVFIYHMLRDRRDYLATQSRGSTFMNLSKELLEHLSMPQLDVSLQQSLGAFLADIERSSCDFRYWAERLSSTEFSDLPRLMARIEALAAKIAEARGLRRELMDETPRLYTTQRDRLFRTMEYDRLPIGSAFDLFNGRAFKPEDWELSGRKIVRIQNLKHPEAPYNYYSGQVEDKHLLHRGDVLFAWSGQIVSLGAHIWQDEEAILNQHIFNIKPKIPMLPRFVQEGFNALVDEMATHVRGLEMFHIRRKELDLLLFPIPPISEQSRVVDLLDSIQSRITTLKHRQAETAAELDALLPAVLDRAFRGEH